ncbi:hypothetical protein [Candidatus Villigracilis saccharophilus]|uniref:hypothetical protein n=1 Tax=Candidatus Villigracilis saccharophilus TaxID=3140684 RepID=UPI003134B965|nr:hypothetical protein [Anaerolineales bacterium]
METILMITTTKVIEYLRDVDTIQIFGSVKQKGELEKRIVHEGLKGNILAIEAMDKMTDHQISRAKVRERFLAHNRMYESSWLIIACRDLTEY